MSSITKDILYIGVNDYTTDLFESQYPIPEGVTYNSYLILDEKIMVVATASPDFGDAWMQNLKAALGDRKPDYLLIQHMEPDHSSTIADFMAAYPDTVIAASKPALNMVKNFFGTDYPGHNLAIKEGDVISLGRHEISFIAAPMVHWPEVMLAYDSTDKILFSADAFGRFGAPKDHSLDAASELYEQEEWLDEARRYYVGIVGKFGPQVLNVLAKTEGMDIQMICSLHGPVLRNNLAAYLDVYRKWASYTPESDGIVICYSSVYGHTRQAVSELEQMIRAIHKGMNHCDRGGAQELNLQVFDLARTDSSYAAAMAFACDKVVLATTTYNTGIFPCMKDFINHLKNSAFQNRKVALIENGTWAPKAAGVMKELLADCPGITYIDPVVSVKSALTEAGREQLKELARALTV